MGIALKGPMTIKDARIVFNYLMQRVTFSDVLRNNFYGLTLQFFRFDLLGFLAWSPGYEFGVRSTYILLE